MLTTEQKIREQLAQNTWRFQHEGSKVVRWITGGTAPDAYVTFHKTEDKIVARCATCQQEMGRFDAGYGHATYRELAAVRERYAKHEHQK
jgi:hypothetical protein